MNVLAFISVKAQSGTKVLPARKFNLATAQAVGAAVGLVGGTAAGLLGVLLIAAGWLVANDAVRHWLSITGSVLLCLTIPLIVLAAFCLDWMEKDEPQRRSKVARYDDEDDEF